MGNFFSSDELVVIQAAIHSALKVFSDYDETIEDVIKIQLLLSSAEDKIKFLRSV